MLKNHILACTWFPFRIHIVDSTFITSGIQHNGKSGICQNLKFFNYCFARIWLLF